MIALLEHPAIVPVYDMGEEDGQPYIVMRYMSGGSLGDKLKNGPIPLRECMEMYLRLAPALDTAHARGVTHRDVKPDNLLFDKYDNVFLSDFGLARLRETIGFANISDGTIMGTPAYMSPEQIQGDHEIDGRSDIYSMGVVLYQMLCGEVPFYGTTAASVMMMHLVNPVPQILEKNRSLPTAIQTVLDTALAKKPDDRYQSAGEFAKAIQAVTTGVHRKPAIRGTQIKVETSKLNSPAPATSAAANGNLTPAPETVAGVPKPAASMATPAPRKSEAHLSPSTSHPDPVLKKRFILPVWGWLVSAAVILLLSLVIILWSQGVFSSNHSSGALLSPDNPVSEETQSSHAIGTVTGSAQTPIVLGQADKLAFVKSSDIWASNLDGSDLVQLTSDGDKKSNLHWTPDGQSVIYTSGSCINLVGLHTKEVITLTCFSGVPSISAFDISPDGQQVALGLDQSKLYLLPYTQLFNLRQESLPADIQALARCSYYAPYDTGNILKAAAWSLANNRLAMLLSTMVDGTYRDQVSVVDFNQCSASPLLVKAILPTHFLFTLRGYYDHPEITGLSWNGNDQLLLNGYVKEGFGDMQLYNLVQDQSQELAPNGSCCYRDAHWSPDGSYLFYSYQPEPGGEVSLYYTPASSLSQPAKSMASLALPAGFLAGSQESLQPALRAAH
jgi:serine/threonine protein kinase